MRPRILVLGSSGQLGRELSKALPPVAEVTALSRHDVDLTNENELRSAVRTARPHFIVNAAAYTAVDRAESEPELAQAVNARAPGILAEEAHRGNAWLFHFSTDYVFDGSGHMPWKETDTPHPLNVYGRTKLEGEQAVAAVGGRHVILRTSWVYAAHGSNFLRTMLRLSRERTKLNIVDDQIGAPTSAGELARGVRFIVERLQELPDSPPDSGIYHMTCGGFTSWFGFAKAIFASFADDVPAPELVPIPSEQYPTPAVRPRNSVLNGDKLQTALGLRLDSWESALARVVDQVRTTSF
jgi:dTDP-4-dehydrorhamnose reductase